jgi:hypothetical protein
MLMRPAFLLSWDILFSLLVLWVGPASLPILGGASTATSHFLYHGIALGGSDLEG